MKILNKKESIELNTKFKQALNIIEKTNENIFITGKAGTGKSTLLTYFRNNTKKNHVVLASTGVAALNVSGQTIHNFFNFYIDITPEKIITKKVVPKKKQLYKKLKTIIIDEISMVRADLLDCVDVFLRMYGPNSKKPFGGVQMVFIGDLYQLPPVVTSKEKELFKTYYTTPYFFSSKAFENFKINIIELEKIYRQKDKKFIELLNKVRNNTIEEDDIERINSRFSKDFKPKKSIFHITLTTRNQKAEEINDVHLKKLKTKLQTSMANIGGDFGKEYYPTAVELNFKVGAQIMLLNNDQKKRWVNGSIGIIESIGLDEDNNREFLLVRLQNDNSLVEIYKYTWEVFRFSFDGEKIVSEAIGTFTQYPFRLAWAVTIHKSQGKTFDNLIIDIGKGTFVTGQMYVALSRCVSFEGVVLKTPIKKHHIRTDWRIFNFLTEYQYKKAKKELSIEDKVTLIKEAIRQEKELKIIYLKASNIKSKRTVIPFKVGKKSYCSKTFLGMDAFCTKRQEDRVFRIDRILKIEEV